MIEDHRYDGADPDQPHARPLGWKGPRTLCQDLQDLKAMSDADIKRYAGI
jgi:hypothetical protein